MHSLFVLCVLAVSAYGWNVQDMWNMIGLRDEQQEPSQQPIISPSYNHPICAKYECHQYKVIETKENYEIRSWPNTVLAANVYDDRYKSFSEATRRNLDKMQRYLNGENSLKQQIKMVYPVLHMFMLKKNEDGQMERIHGKYAMAIFLPEKYQKGIKPPTPNKEIAYNKTNHKGVLISPLPGPTEFYASSFEGKPTDEKVKEVRQKLEKALNDDRVAFYNNYAYMMEYHDPLHRGKESHTDIYYESNGKKKKEKEQEEKGKVELAVDVVEVKKEEDQEDEE